MSDVALRKCRFCDFTGQVTAEGLRAHVQFAHDDEWRKISGSMRASMAGMERLSDADRTPVPPEARLPCRYPHPHWGVPCDLKGGHPGVHQSGGTDICMEWD